MDYYLVGVGGVIYLVFSTLFGGMIPVDYTV